MKASFSRYSGAHHLWYNARMSDNESEKIVTDMNLRTQTIWIAVAMLIVTITVSALSGLGDSLFFWLLTGSPSVIFLALAIKLKHDNPISILRVSTIIYAIWYAYGAYHLLFVPPYWGAAVYFGLTGLIMLPAMIIVWISTLVLDGHYAKKPLADSENPIE